MAISCGRGRFYVLLSGSGACIRNIEVTLDARLPDRRVPEDHSTIQEAVDAALPGEVIDVAAGIYSGPGNHNIELRGKAVTLQGRDGAARTILVCGSQPDVQAGATSRGFFVHEEEGRDTVIKGFTLTGGIALGEHIPPDDGPWPKAGTYSIGGGILCQNTSPTILDCVITQCQAKVGGGIGIVGGMPVVADCLIEGCQASWGSGMGLVGHGGADVTHCVVRSNLSAGNGWGCGIHVRGGRTVLAGCEIAYNAAPDKGIGGGVYATGPGLDLTIQNCVVVGNVAEEGAGLFAEGAGVPGPAGDTASSVNRVHLAYCTVADNRLTGSGVLPAGAAGARVSGCQVIVRNSILYRNQGRSLVLDSPVGNAVSFCDVERGFAGEGNIDEDPLFAPGQYHVQSWTGRYVPSTGLWVQDKVHGPCIDAGDPTVYPQAEPRPNGSRLNMGAFGGTDYASMSLRSTEQMLIRAIHQTCVRTRPKCPGANGPENRDSQKGGWIIGPRLQDRLFGIGADEGVSLRLRGGPVRQAFSLIELLVVLSILSLMLGLAMPTLRLVRTRCRAMRGMGNQRDVVGAANFYAMDHDDRYPQSVAKVGFNDQWNWSDPTKLAGNDLRTPGQYRSVGAYLKAYLPNAGSISCPQAPSTYPYLQAAWDAGDDWDNPDTPVYPDVVGGTFCLYWNYIGHLGDKGLFRGPARPAGGRGFSPLLISDYLGCNPWRTPGSHASCDWTQGARAVPETQLLSSYWVIPGDPNGRVLSVRSMAGFTDGHVEGFSYVDTLPLRVIKVRSGDIPYSDDEPGPGVFYLPGLAVK